MLLKVIESRSIYHSRKGGRSVERDWQLVAQASRRAVGGPANVKRLIVSSLSDNR